MSAIILMDLYLHVGWSFCLRSFNVSSLLYIFIILTLIWCVVSSLLLFGILCVSCVWIWAFFSYYFTKKYLPCFWHEMLLLLLYPKLTVFFHGVPMVSYVLFIVLNYHWPLNYVIWSLFRLSSGLTVCSPWVSLLMVPTSESLIWLIEFFTFHHHFSLAVFSCSIFFSIFTLFIRK